MSDERRPAAIAWTSGGDATVVRADGVQIRARSSVPFPPGTPVGGTVRANATVAFVVKVTSSRRVANGIWEVRGRLVSPSAATIAAFARLAEGEAAGY